MKTGKTPTTAELIAGMYKRIALALIRHKDALAVTSADTPSTVVLSAHAHHEDHGKLIGSGGITFNAIKLLLKTACDRRGKSLTFQQVKPPGPKSPPQPFVDNPTWDRRPLEELLAETCACMFCYEAAVSVEDVDKITTVRVDIHDAEPVEDDRDLNEAMGIIIRAVGLASGRTVTFDLVRRQEAAR